MCIVWIMMMTFSQLTAFVLYLLAVNVENYSDTSFVFMIPPISLITS
jgi:hypothetical protein